MQQKKIYWVIIVLLLCITIFYLTSSSHSTFIETEQIFHKYNWYVRKMAHILIFGLLAVAVQRILKNNKFSYLLAWIFVTAYGLTDEWHQIFVPNRTPLLSDVAKDSAGAFLALAIVYLRFHFRKVHYKSAFVKDPLPDNPDSQSFSPDGHDHTA